MPVSRARRIQEFTRAQHKCTCTGVRPGVIVWPALAAESRRDCAPPPPSLSFCVSHSSSLSSPTLARNLGRSCLAGSHPRRSALPRAQAEYVPPFCPPCQARTTPCRRCAAPACSR
eukprot:6196047-Pleurochrysis_carterae.AAC.11